MEIQSFFDRETNTLSYLVYDPGSRDAIVIDPVLNFDPALGTIRFTSAQEITETVDRYGLEVRAILETHIHADHLSASHYIKERYPNALLAISERVVEVQQGFRPLFHWQSDFPVDGSQFGHLLSENETFQAGSLEVRAIPTPGHTPCCVSYLIGDAVFTGDALFMPDSGTGRCDFPGGSAADLYRSIHGRLYELPEATRVFVGHDYQPGGRELAYCTTIGEQRSQNIHLRSETTEEEFVALREERDQTLRSPRLMLPSLQVNCAGGQLPPPRSNGVSYLVIPLQTLDR